MRDVRYVDYFEDSFSSVISKAWLAENGDVFIQFVGGSVAGYAAVGRRVWDEFTNSPSLGSYYNQHIRGLYTGLDGNVRFVTDNAVVQPVTPVASPNRVQVTGNKSRFDVVYAMADGSEIVYTTEALNENDAVVEAQNATSKMSLNLKIVRVVHYF